MRQDTLFSLKASKSECLLFENAVCGYGRCVLPSVGYVEYVVSFIYILVVLMSLFPMTWEEYVSVMYNMWWSLYNGYVRMVLGK
jgi:hypothetical protein